MKFTGKFIGARIDISAYQRQLEENMLEMLHASANAWLQAVVGRIPLWSGMARASLLELRELVGGQIIFSPLKAKSRIPQGQALGTAIQEFENNRATITITTDVPHYNLQEYQSGRSPTAPWRSLQAGANAFWATAKSFRPIKPKLKPIKIRTI